jgi:hypothetical protein
MKTQKLAMVAGKAILLAILGLLVYHGQASTAVSPKAKATPAKAKAVTAEKYAVLNPRGELPPIDAQALAPRLPSLEGKTVYVNGSDGAMNPGQEIMLMIARGLARTVPGIKVVYMSDRYGDATTDSVVPAIRIVKNRVDTDMYNTCKEAEQKADAVVTGLGF